MARLIHAYFWQLLICCFLFGICCPAAALTSPTLAFYYGDNPPLTQLLPYGRVVFEPSSNLNPRQFTARGGVALAYVAMGEMDAHNRALYHINPKWIIGTNSTWQSQVIDQSNPDWQHYFITHIITPLWQKGYRGFFLDTLDSYQLAVPQQQFTQQQAGQIAVIRAIKQQYPDAQLILNRGFELLPEIHTLIDGVAAESLFAGWDNRQKRYVTVPDTERRQLLTELNTTAQFGLPVIVIDYLPAGEPNKVTQIAAQIRTLGFQPWITNHDLTALYLKPTTAAPSPPQSLNNVPRKILIFYNGKPNDVDDKLNSIAVTKVAMPLNHLGYITIFRNINDPFPNVDRHEYAGIIMASIGALTGREAELRAWYQTQLRQHIPLVILNDFGFSLTNKNAAIFNLSYPFFPHPAHATTLLHRSPLLGYELFPTLRAKDFVPLTIKSGKSLIKLRDELGTAGDMAAITPWGGYVLYPYVVLDIGEGDYAAHWVLEPFAFFTQALRLPTMPVPDTTTENGRRLMLAHIDGDSFANRGKWFQGPFVGEIMQKEVLQRYNVPTTVSIIEGELAPNGLYPKLSPQLEQIARQIFALPNVEIASHTFSHPFNWQKVGRPRVGDFTVYNLPIPNYTFNLRAEIIGSVDYINRVLAPKNKHCKVFLWSGEADVDEQALAMTQQLGLSNLNGGHTSINYLQNSLTNVSGLGVHEGPYFEVFAPITNDFEITENRKKPLYSIISTIDILKLTDQPRRLKPIDIYNHFYAVEEIGGIKAVQAVYDWSLAQPVMNIYVSDFTAKVADFNDLTIVKENQGWRYFTHGQLRELRVPQHAGYPDLAHSSNVIGYSAYNDDYYIHLGPGNEALVRLTDQPPTLPYLHDANARVSRFTRTQNGFEFTLVGYMPLKFTLANVDNCRVTSDKKSLTAKSHSGNQQSFELARDTQHDFTIHCS